MNNYSPNQSLEGLVENIREWAKELGFSQVGITNIDLNEHEQYLKKWLKQGYHGNMQYMNRAFPNRAKPKDLIPETCRIISVRMNYSTPEANNAKALSNPKKAFISRYALGRDYHKTVRKRLSALAKLISEKIKRGNYRAFVDSAPILERAIAEKAGLGWIAKNSMLINEQAGSWFFLGEIYTDIPLPEDTPKRDKHCGTCTACLEKCPTNAFVEPFVLDAKKCISYLTIENKGPIEESLRSLIGNRIFGCDDCQLVCPWNKFAVLTQEDDFKPRHQLNDIDLVEAFLWDEETFLRKTSGSAIRRIGYILWLRNLAVALGNAPTSEEILNALKVRLNFPSTLVREHIEWALTQHNIRVTKNSKMSK